MKNNNKLYIVDVDYIGTESDARSDSKKYNISIQISGSTSAMVVGDIISLLSWLVDVHGLDIYDIKEFYPELFKDTKKTAKMFLKLFKENK